MDTVINILLLLVVIWFITQRIIPPRGVGQIDTTKLKKMLKNKREYQFVDVRTPVEFNANRIKSFKNIPLAEVKQRQHELSKDRAVVVICQSGARSNRASRVLKGLGFDVINVKGGMSAWRP